MPDDPPHEPPASAPVRVLDLALPDATLAEALLGAGQRAARCRVVFVHMLPAGEGARLVALLPHGLVIAFSQPTPDQYARLVVPWSRIAYITAE